MGRRYLVTGGAGFIGSNFVRWVLDHENGATITNLDAMTYAGVPATVAEFDDYPGHRFVEIDIRDAALVDEVVPGHDVIVHFAAESHVDRSIAGPATFLETNVVGTGGFWGFR
jgi:dTDP-glucose 4,6-dehydratase